MPYTSSAATDESHRNVSTTLQSAPRRASPPAAPGTARGPSAALIAAAAALLLGSGFAALVYQTAWLRALRLIFGGSTPAMGAVLAIFLGGLGLGGLVLGRRAEAHARPLRLYARLELGISVAAFLSPWLIALAEWVYLGLGGSAALGAWPATAVRVVLAAVVLGVPVVLMGGTLPALARVVTRSEDTGRRALALLYATNTLGAVAGALLPTFWLFERFGVRRTLWLACALNGLVALAAWLLARGRAARGLEAPDVVDPQPADPAPPEPNAGARPARAPDALVLGAAFASGFAFLLAEIVWYRMSAPILGGSTYTFGTVLACALLGIGVGGLLYGARPPRRPSVGIFAMTCALEAALLLGPLALGDDLARLADRVRAWDAHGFWALASGWCLVSALVCLPASIVAGYQFPLLVALKGTGRANVAADTGQVYAANTLGAIVGSLAGGFWLLPALTAPGAWRLAAFALLGMGAIFCVLAALRGEGRRALAFGLVGAATVAAALAPGPSALWRHAAIGAGRARLYRLPPNARVDTEHALRRQIIIEREGRESSLGFAAANGLSLYVDGKSDGNAVTDGMTTVLLGLLGAVLHPEPQSGFVIGVASGETAGWLAETRSVTRVDAWEIEPAVVEFAALCAPANHDALRHTDVRVHVGCGREALQTAPTRYDLVVSEPSNPFRAGVADFFTADFYTRARARLAPGGLFVQWLQAYEIDPASFRLALATFGSVFEHVSVWHSKPGDFLLVGSGEPLVFDAGRVRARLREEPYRSGFGRVCGIFDAEGVLALYLGDQRLLEALGADTVGDVVNTDDRNVLEYRLARSVGDDRAAIDDTVLYDAARSIGAERPRTIGGPVDWDRVRYLRPRSWQVTGATSPPRFAALSADPRQAFWRFREQARWSEAAAAWRSVATRPSASDPFERLCAAEATIAAGAGDPSLPDELMALERAGYATDVAWLRLARQLGEPLDEAATLAAARAAIDLAREDPWVQTGLVSRVLARLSDAKLAPAAAREAAGHLAAGPFSVYACETARRLAATLLALRSGDHELAARAFELSEPNPIWNLDALRYRALTYKIARPARYAAALSDLSRFLAYEEETSASD